jgi:hypothetical protein
VEENTNIDVFKEIEENYMWSNKYAKAQMNVLDEIPQSYSHQGNLKLDQTKYIWKHGIMNMDLEVAGLFSKV